jgi:hypothetical protein
MAMGTQRERELGVIAVPHLSANRQVPSTEEVRSVNDVSWAD